MARRSSAEESEENDVSLHPKFSDVLIGHEDVERQMLGLIAQGKLPHALLITGPQGIGKATFAYRLARFLLVPQEKGGLFGDAEPARSMHIPVTHPTSRRMIAGSHPDILILEGNEIKTDEARKVSEFLSLTPAESAWRVVIIDSADALNRNAANALLKILEEPPAQAVIILLSHNPGSLLPTIRSRCRTYRMRLLNDKEFAAVLSRVAPQVDEADYALWSVFSDGSPGVALSLIENKANVIYKDLLEIISNPEPLKLHPFAERFARREQEAAWHTLGRLIPWLYLRILTSASQQMEVFSGEGQMLRALLPTKPLDLWTELWEKSAKLIADTMRLHLDRKQAILTLVRAAAE